MSILERLSLEIAKEQACLEDLYVVVGVYTKRGDLYAAAECGKKIVKVASNIEKLKAHLNDQQNFLWVINDLKNRGLLGRELKKYAHQS
ncbi:hypothetical protein [Lysinibacillus xylanilyticus]|uniref:hypothetical protein n=1 Tax=Lysinibacillus xylanilyticus TaxID=582475 RepID=UPI003D0752D5